MTEPMGPQERVSEGRLDELISRTGPSNILHVDDEADMNAALCELRSRRAADAWRPIETAPKDGRSILLGRVGATRAYTGEYVTAGSSGWWRDTHGQQREPTHWRPIPPPPSKESM